MNVEENIKVMDVIERAVNERDWKTFDEQHVPTVLAYSPLTSEPTKDIESHREAVKGMSVAFPDFHMKTVRSFGQGDWVCTEFVMTGTHKKPLNTDDGKVIPPTNKKISLSLISSIKLKDGKIVEERTFYDRIIFLSQLGLLPK